MGQTEEDVSLAGEGRAAVGDRDAIRGSFDDCRFAVRAFEEVEPSQGLSRGDVGSDIDETFKQAGLGSEHIVVGVECLNPAGGSQAEVGAALFLSLQDLEVNQDIVQTGLRRAVHAGRSHFAATHFGGDDSFAHVFGFDGQEPFAGDVGVKECEIGIVSECGLSHTAALFEIIDQVQVGTGIKVNAASASVQVDDDINPRKDFRGEVVGHDFGDGAFRVSGKTAVEIFAIQGGESRGCFGGGDVDRGDEDDAAGNLFQLQGFHQFHNGDGTGVFISMITGHEEHGGAFAIGHGGDGDLQLRPAAQVVREGNIERTPLSAGLFKVDLRTNGSLCHVVVSVWSGEV